MDAVQQFDQLNRFHVEPGLLPYFADHCLAEGLAYVNQSPRYGPLPLQWFRPPLDQQHPVLVNDDSTHPYKRRQWELSLQHISTIARPDAEQRFATSPNLLTPLSIRANVSSTTVISFDQFMTGVVMGCILIIIGSVPGLLDKWAEALSNMAETILYRMPIASRGRTEFGQQRWLAALGLALISVSLFLYTSR